MLWLIFVLVGCADPAPPVTYQWQNVTLPDGSAGVAVNCRGDIGNCYERSGRACPRGYDVLDKDGHASVVGEGSANRYNANWNARATFRGVLVIRCH